MHPHLAIFDRTFGEGRLLPARFDSPQARHQLLAISGQEADLTHRWQVIDRSRPWVMGPAHGLWQFELGTRASRGGITGLYLHTKAGAWLQTACRRAGVEFEPRAIWDAIVTDDVLACAVARIALLVDPHPLPGIGEVWPAWDCYNRIWRPGKPHPDDWPENYARATRILTQGAPG